MKINILIRDFLFHCEVERALAENTVLAYRRDLDHFVRFQLTSAYPLFSREQLKSYLACMLGDMNLSTATARRRLSCLKALLSFASEKVDFVNPFEDWSPSLKRPTKLPRALTSNELRLLVRQSSDNSSANDETVFHLLLLTSTGLRISEFCNVNTRDVLPDGAAIRVNGKGSRERMVYIGNKELNTRLAQERSAALKSRGPDEPLFLNQLGGRLLPQVFRRRVHALAKARGIDNRVTPHMFRHTAATLLLENGADIRFVQRLLGHASIATTEIYTHVSDEALQRAVSKADPLLSIA